MLILLSPSKSQDFSSEPPTDIGIKPEFLKESQAVAHSLKKYTSNDIAKLMHVSAKLADFTYDRTQNWSTSFKSQKKNKDNEYNFKQAIFAYTGNVYKAFENNIHSKADYAYMEKNIRILSGLYGITTPLTYIKPYRLEMGTRLAIRSRGKDYNNLYQFWGDILHNYIIDTFRKNEPIINLASLEYSKAINLKRFGNRVFDVEFKIQKDGKLFTIGVIAKRLRGEMAQWLIQNKTTHVEDIKTFKKNGFAFSKKNSTSNTLVFTKT